MNNVPNVLGGPNTVMPMGIGAPGQTSSPPKAEGLVNLTEPRKLPESVNVFGPPSPGQEGYAEYLASKSRPAPTVPQAAAGAGGDIPRSVPLDTPPSEAIALQSVAVVPDPGGNYELTPVAFVLAEGTVRCSYPIVILNESGTCLVLGALDPPPGAALFSPMRSKNLEVVVGQGQNALRYGVVSFDASFKLGSWNLLVLAILDGPPSNREDSL